MNAEKWSEYAETDPEAIRQQYAEAPENMRAALDVVRRSSPERLTYEAIERALQWPRGRLRSVIGGWRSRDGAEYTRPYRICPPDLSPKGEWEMWMDSTQSAALDDLSHPGQIEKQFPRYALAYLRYLAGERKTVPTPTPQPLYDGITPAEIPAVQQRVRELVQKLESRSR